MIESPYIVGAEAIAEYAKRGRHLIERALRSRRLRHVERESARDPWVSKREWIDAWIESTAVGGPEEPDAVPDRMLDTGRQRIRRLV